MRGGKVNYTCGSLARAKTRSKPQSPKRPASRRITSSALFPPKVLLTSPHKFSSSFPLDQTPGPSSPTKSTSGRGQVKTNKEYMMDSDFVMARRAAEGIYNVDVDEKKGKGWWVGIARTSKDGKRYEAELERRLAREENKSEESGRVGESSIENQDSRIAVKTLLTRPDFLDTPHWLRRLPRENEQIIEARSDFS